MFGSTYTAEVNKPALFFENCLSSSTVFGAYHKNKIIGLATFTQEAGIKFSHKAHLSSVFIEPEFRGRGVAGQLLEEVLEYSKKQVEQILLTVADDNKPAIHLYEKLGFHVIPGASEVRHDIIQAVELGSREGMIAFCKGIQAAAPVDSYVTPEPAPMPGYDSDVIMAAGAFVQGSSIELSADGPTRPPYAVYFQGGLTWYHAKLGILMSLQKMLEAGLISL